MWKCLIKRIILTWGWSSFIYDARLGSALNSICQEWQRRKDIWMNKNRKCVVHEDFQHLSRGFREHTRIPSIVPYIVFHMSLVCVRNLPRISTCLWRFAWDVSTRRKTPWHTTQRDTSADRVDRGFQDHTRRSPFSHPFPSFSLPLASAFFLVSREK